MSTRELERELKAILHRHAEDAMDSTDTHAEHERLNDDVLEAEPRTDRRRLAVGAAVAAAVAAVGVWTAGSLGDDGDIPPAVPPANVSSDLEIAQGFVDAYGDGDLVRAATYLAPAKEPYPDWEFYVERNVAWDVTFLFEPCEVKTETPAGTALVCPFDLHVLHSDELGEGPFTGNTFTVYVQDGAVTQADDQMPFETNGQGDYFDSVFAWVERNFPADTEFLFLDEPDVPKAQRSRWLRMWEHRLDAYLEAMTSEGNG
ncbi:MAG: hypothetical protein ACRDO4_12475 [Nocardioides sp.]